MKFKKNFLVGIVGGGGPVGTVLFECMLIEKMQEYLRPLRDSDYIPIIIDNDPRIEDRTESIFKGKNSLIKSYHSKINRLEKIGVNLAVIACNTAHFFWNEILADTRIDLIHMIKESALYFSLKYPNVKKVGLLATMGTYKCKIYQMEYKKYNIDIEELSEENELVIHQLIYLVKSGMIPVLNRCLLKNNNFLSTELDKSHQSISQTLKKIMNHFKKRGVSHIILGCTELSENLFRYIDKELVFVDSSEAVCTSIINKYRLSK